MLYTFGWSLFIEEKKINNFETLLHYFLKIIES